MLWMCLRMHNWLLVHEKNFKLYGMLLENSRGININYTVSDRGIDLCTCWWLIQVLGNIEGISDTGITVRPTLKHALAYIGNFTRLL